MRATTALRSWAGLAVAAIGACAPDLDLDPTSVVESAIDSCQTNSCGNGNSPVIDGVYFWRMNLKGEDGPEGLQVLGVLSPANAPMRLELVSTEGDRLRGVIPGRPPIYVEHTALNGTKIKVAVPVDGVTRYYQIEIVWVAPNESFWVGSEAAIEAYRFSYRPIVNTTPTGAPIALCSDEDASCAES